MTIDETTAKSIGGAIGSLTLVVLSSKWWVNRSIKKHESSDLSALFKRNSDLTDRYLKEIERLGIIITRYEARIATLETENCNLEQDNWKLVQAAKPS